MIIGTAGDRPDDTLRGIGRIAAERAQRVAIKETHGYLRGRTREAVVGELLAGIKAGGGSSRRRPGLSVRDGCAPSRAERRRGAPVLVGGRPERLGWSSCMCHEERDEVFALLDELGARPIDVASELTELLPRLQDRPRR